MKKRVLLVDDNPDTVETLTFRLKANNYDVISVTNSTYILKTVEEVCPDIIILDIVMPDLNGYDVCSILKSGKRTKKIPILLFTGKELEPQGIVKRCLDLGVEGYLLKPVDSSFLIKKIEELTKKKL